MKMYTDWHRDKLTKWKTDRQSEGCESSTVSYTCNLQEYKIDKQLTYLE